ncbi:MAG: hypothetical protein IT360_24760 [Gemmatimonadaceae bacterium]|nr:hypothetical protein [Gemmatimonadaceae bacterium]
MERRAFWALGALLVAGACGGGGATGGGGAPQARSAPTRGNSNVIIEAEIAASGATSAMEAVQRLRPAMLRSRGAGSSVSNPGGDPIAVYVDGVRAGGPEALNNVTGLSVKEIRFIGAADATTRFGTGHVSGAILVTTKR